MRSLFLTSALLLCTGIVTAQKIDTTVYSACATKRERIDMNVGQGTQKAIYNIIFDSCPEFKGGAQALGKYFSISIKNANIKARNIFVSFIIEKDGHLNNGKIIRGVSNYYDDLSLKLIRSSPKWKPAILKGKPARMSYVIPIRMIKT